MPLTKDEETAKSVRSNGHSASGGHSTRAVTPAIRQQTAFSRINRSRWDVPDTSAGNNMPYQFQEYPKHVYPNPDNHKHFVVVNSADEESKILGGEEVVNDEDERHRLLTVASINKVPVDRRWGPAKITKAIEDAGFDPTANPFE